MIYSPHQLSQKFRIQNKLRPLEKRVLRFFTAVPTEGLFPDPSPPEGEELPVIEGDERTRMLSTAPRKEQRNRDINQEEKMIVSFACMNNWLFITHYKDEPRMSMNSWNHSQFT